MRLFHGGFLIFLLFGCFYSVNAAERAMKSKFPVQPASSSFAESPLVSEIYMAPGVTYETDPAGAALIHSRPQLMSRSESGGIKLAYADIALLTAFHPDAPWLAYSAWLVDSTPHPAEMLRLVRRGGVVAPSGKIPWSLEEARRYHDKIRQTIDEDIRKALSIWARKNGIDLILDYSHKPVSEKSFVGRSAEASASDSMTLLQNSDSLPAIKAFVADQMMKSPTEIAEGRLGHFEDLLSRPDLLLQTMSIELMSIDLFCQPFSPFLQRGPGVFRKSVFSLFNRPANMEVMEILLERKVLSQDRISLLLRDIQEME
ncbi:MAG: hypothetical protein CVV64_12980 [Candidatus Wallbacteria bacterium HGW-Wallbacteria-1]|jgi:hypothetical protein|uniref:Uncharacterized protein n=1 Tax=Candidatus Wallbacteria bacterium HGW-Wallbacteria-1 TaxID=2013854 RepID=A0A2N1PMY3_9BACT|nr:MAG: hypothetical protein CVV64_12980 [Candidatus Wallbacteria bacterium HGW-Wallbacteria-1]